jgi:Fur family transcriptional regulator, zinc uptake regulator
VTLKLSGPGRRRTRRPPANRPAGPDAEIQALCDQFNLTLIRATVLKTLLHAEKPMGAYDVLALAARALKRDLKPMTIYRAIDFLERVGLITRIQSLGAYVANPSRHASARVFYICDQCLRSSCVEAEAVDEAILQTASSLGFAVNRKVVECAGLCAECAATIPATE